MTLHEELRALIEDWRHETYASFCADALEAILARHPEQAAPGLSEEEAKLLRRTVNVAWSPLGANYDECMAAIDRLTAPAQPAQPEPSEPEPASITKEDFARLVSYLESDFGSLRPDIHARHIIRELGLLDPNATPAHAAQPEPSKPERWRFEPYSEESKRRCYDAGLWPWAEVIIDGGNKPPLLIWGPRETVDTTKTETLAAIVISALDQVERKGDT